MKVAVWCLLTLVCGSLKVRCLSLSTKETERIKKSRVEWNISKPDNFKEMNTNVTNVSSKENTTVSDTKIEGNNLKQNNTKETEILVKFVKFWSKAEPDDEWNKYMETKSGSNLNDKDDIKVTELEVEWNISKLKSTKHNETVAFKLRVKEYESGVKAEIWSTEEETSAPNISVHGETNKHRVDWNVLKLNSNKETLNPSTEEYGNVMEPEKVRNVPLLNNDTKEGNKSVPNLSAEKGVSENVEWILSRVNGTKLDKMLLNMTQTEFQDYDEIFTNFTSEYYDEQGDKSFSRILGGTAAATGEYPFAVYVANVNMQRGCSGVIISNLYILTAASCVYDATSVYAYPGVIAPVGASPFVTGSAIIHPHFYLNTLEHDVALIKLSTPLTFSGTVNRIRLAKKYDTDDYHDLVGKSVRVFGFGLESTGGTAPVLRLARMNVLPFSQCYKAMKTGNIKPANTQNCLDTEGGTVGMCSYVDVGGPVVYRFKDDSDYSLVGILSYYQICRSSVPNLFTRIGPYVDLIQKYVPSFLTG